MEFNKQTDKDLPTSTYAELGRALNVVRELDKMEMQCRDSNFYELVDYLKSQLKLAMQDLDSDSGECEGCCGTYNELHKDDPRINAEWIAGLCHCNKDTNADVLTYDQR